VLVTGTYGILSTSANRMQLKKKSQMEKRAQRWAARLMESVRQVLACYPEADSDTVRHTLILLEQPPLELEKEFDPWPLPHSAKMNSAFCGPC